MHIYIHSVEILSLEFGPFGFVFLQKFYRELVVLLSWHLVTLNWSMILSGSLVESALQMKFKVDLEGLEAITGDLRHRASFQTLLQWQR